MRKFSFFLLLVLSAGIASAQTASWTAVLPALFPTNVSGQIHGISRISQMKFHATDPNKMYAVSARGGIFITTDGGNNWTVTPGTDVLTNGTRLASVCVDFTNDQIIYLGLGDHNYYYSGNGVMKSTDGGQTFTQTGLTGKLVPEMVMDPLDHNVVVAVTHTGIYKTINGGTSWTLKSPSREFDDLKQKAATSRVLYACTTDSAFFRSTDFGDTWSQITTGIVLPTGITNGNGCRLAVTPADTNVVYLGMTANSGLIYKSVNGGTSFTAMKTSASPYLTYYSNSATSSGQGDYNFSIGVDRLNAATLYLVAHNVWKSTNSGASWTQLTNWYEKVHTDMHQIITSPYDNNKLYDVNDGGVWLSTDGGNNWTPKSNGIFGYEIYHGMCSSKRKDMFSIGTQDNGELYATSAGWFTNRGGDWGSRCDFDYRTNSSMVYYYDNAKRRLVTGSEATYGLPFTSLQDIAFHRSDANLAFAGNSNVYRTTNLTTTTPAWTQITTFSKPIMAIHSSFADPNRLYIITSDNTFYVSTNALAATPTFTSYTLPNTTNNSASITTIKTNPNVIYVTCNTKVYRSQDNGATWTNITYNLPSVNHVRVLADEYFSASELVFVASNNAVYYKNAAASGWSIYNTLLPLRTSIMDLSIFNDSTANTALRVSTYGRGMWETPISNLRALNAGFAAGNLNPCIGEQVSFTDLSTGNVATRSWSFPGGTPSSSTAANPVVAYSAAGAYSVTLTVGDGAGGTNSLTQTNYINTSAASLPLTEGFEGTTDPPAGWKNIDNGGNGYQWLKTNATGGYGNSANAMVFDNYSWNVPGQKDELIVKRLDFAGYGTASLSFDLAYQVYTGYSDTLAVLVSTDCGNTYTRIYAKGGSVLSTAGSGANNFVPMATQWRTDTVSLNAYCGNPSLLIAFENINGYGNKLYLDNVNIYATVTANAGPDHTICAGNSVSIGMPPVSGVNYSWSPTTGLSSAVISNPSAAPSVTTQYILTATHALSGLQKKDTVLITVNPKPVVNAGAYASVCSNAGPVSLSGSPAGGSFSGTGVSGSSFNPAVGAGTYIITYSYTNANGCSNSDTAAITVSGCGCTQAPAKPGKITLAGGGTKICPGETRTYSIASVATATGYNWVLPTGAVITSGQGSVSVLVSFNSSFTASGTLSVTAVNACGSSPATTKTVTRGATPGAPSAISGNNFGVCSTAQPYSVTNVSGINYAWSFNTSGVLIASGQGTSGISASFSSSFLSGILSVTAGNGCGTSAAKNLTIKAIPATPAAISGAAAVCANQAAVPYSTSAVSNAVSYTWTAPKNATITAGSVTSSTNTLTTTATSVLVNYGNKAGSIKVSANNACGASGVKSLSVSITCKPPAAPQEDGLKIFPTPADDVLRISFNSAHAGMSFFRIIDASGKEVLRFTQTVTEGKTEREINTSGMAAGVYQIIVSNGDRNYKDRFVVIH